MDETLKLIGDRIKDRREEMGLMPADLSRASGRSISAVMQWESNSTKNLKLDNLFAIADLLEVEPRWLVTGAPPKLRFAQAQHEEIVAMQKLREAVPEWRKYVLTLAMVNRDAQASFLATMGVTVPDSAVQAAFGPAPKRKALE